MKCNKRVTLKLLFLTIILFVPFLSGCATQFTAHLSQSSASSGPPSDGYGLYESCSPNDEAACLSHLDAMAAAGFKLVLNYDQLDGDASFQKAYLAHAQSVGMKVIMPFKDERFYNGKSLRSDFSALAATCDCTDNTGFIQYVVNLVKDSPALWGYYIGDEVDPGQHDELKSRLTDLVHQLDPKHPRLFIDSAKGSTAVWKGNSPFFDTTDVVGTDFYPLRGEASNYPPIDQAGTVAAGTQAYADAHKEESAMVLQAFSYSQYGTPGAPYPTVDQMQSMLSQTLANAHPKIVLWYSYYDTMSYTNADQHWSDLKSVIAHTMP